MFKFLTTFCILLFAGHVSAGTCDDINDFVNTLRANPQSLQGSLFDDDEDGKDYNASKAMPGSTMCLVSYRDDRTSYNCVWTFKMYDQSSVAFDSLFSELKSCTFLEIKSQAPHGKFKSLAIFDGKKNPNLTIFLSEDSANYTRHLGRREVTLEIVFDR